MRVSRSCISSLRGTRTSNNKSMADPTDSKVTKLDFLATNEPLPPEYGSSALKNLQERWNYSETKPIQDFIQQGKWEYVKPYNLDYKDATQNEVKFNIPGTTQDFISEIYLMMDIEAWNTQADAAFLNHIAAGDDARAGTIDAARTLPRPLLPYNMFKDVQLDTNNGRLDFSSGSGYYPLHQLLHMIHSVDQKDADRLKRTHDFDLPPADIDPDMEISTTVDSGAVGAARPQWHKDRLQKLRGRQVYMLPLNIPILNATPVLPVGANVGINLIKNDPSAIFQKSGAGAGAGGIKIHQMELKVKRTSLKPPMLKAVLEEVQKAGHFKYNIIHTKTQKHQLSQGANSATIMFAQTGTKPSKMWVNFMDDRALNGHHERGIFKLFNPRIDTAVAKFDGNNFPFPNGYKFPRDVNPTAYEKLRIYEEMCISNWGSVSHQMQNERWWTQERFENYAHTVVFDLTASQTAHLNTVVKERDESGVVTLDFTFHAAIPQNSVALVTSMYATEIFQGFTTLQPELNAIV